MSESPASQDPLYLELANRLRAELQGGAFVAGARFYSIRDLMKRTKRSLPTVRTAVDMLVKEGLLEPRPGSGIYVTERVWKSSRTVRNFIVTIPSFSDRAESWFTGRLASGLLAASDPETEMISFVQRPPAQDAEARDWMRSLLAMEPHGIVWLHASGLDRPVLQLARNRVAIATTMREVDGLPLVREDDEAYANALVGQLAARGHRHLAVIVATDKDDYYDSKFTAIGRAAKKAGVKLQPAKGFSLYGPGAGKVPLKNKLRAMLEEHPEVTALAVLDSAGTAPLVELMRGPLAARLKRTAIIHNVLDGDALPEVPSGFCIARIEPPLEQIGTRLLVALRAKAEGKAAPKAPQLIPRLVGWEALPEAAG